MPTLLVEDIREVAWRKASDRNGQSPGGGAPANGSQGSEARWRPAIDQIVAMNQLGDNWDGLGARAPTRELLECAVGLASMLHQREVPPPTRVVPSTAGTIIMEWQFGEGHYGEIEVDRPFHAEVMLVAPGDPPKHWELPDA